MTLSHPSSRPGTLGAPRIICGPTGLPASSCELPTPLADLKDSGQKMECMDYILLSAATFTVVLRSYAIFHTSQKKLGPN